MKKTILLILLSPVLFLGANNMEINNEAKKVIYQYAQIIDSRRFDELDSIMWPDFTADKLIEQVGLFKKRERKYGDL